MCFAFRKYGARLSSEMETLECWQAFIGPGESFQAAYMLGCGTVLCSGFLSNTCFYKRASEEECTLPH